MHGERCYNGTNHIRNGRALLEAAPTLSQRSDRPMTTPIVSPDTPQLKRCTKCGETKPLTAFPKDRNTSSGFHSACKSCKSEGNRRYRLENADELREKHRAYYVKTADKQRANSREYNANHADHVREKNRRYRSEHAEELSQKKRARRLLLTEDERERESERRKRSAEKNKETITAYQAEYRAAHRAELREYAKAYRKDNPDKVLEQVMNWRKTPTGKAARRAGHLRRRALKHATGSRKVTAADLMALELGQTDARGRVHCWWCGCVITSRKWHIDHRIPLFRGGTHDPRNLCLSCPDCNMRKHTKLPDEFAGRLL
jgi:5-methylcytosine-specific restriction endonuclease McrA